MAAAETAWGLLNREALAGEVSRVRAALERLCGAAAEGPAERPARTGVGEGDPPAFETLVRLFGLSPFERDVVALCAAAELDRDVPRLCAAAHGDERRTYPTFGLALAAFPEPHWSAVVPSAPLRHWRLVEPRGGLGLTAAPLELDERVLHYVAGVDYTDDRVDALSEPVVAGSAPPATAEAVARAAAEQLRGARVTNLCGGTPATRRAIAAAACATGGRRLRVVAAGCLPSAPDAARDLRRLCEREYVLGGWCFLVEWDALADEDEGRRRAALRFVDELAAPLFVSSREQLAGLKVHPLRLDVPAASAEERRTLWNRALAPHGIALDGEADALLAQFELDAAEIEGAAAQVAGADGPEAARRLWDACRARARPRLDELAQRVPALAGWDDLVLPEPQRTLLREITAHVRHRATVYDEWGFARKSARGLGISALFSGPSGTGKTMAAEVIAGELRLDLYRIDLSSVVSKYIGETEKNLRRLFDAAEGSGAVLLFDEADALFGKRTEVRDSHDRFANIEISYLLQRMEAYRGLALLTTNLREALDPAFLRRIRFVVEFPVPDDDARREIWRGVFPEATPLDRVDPELLARLHVAGGNIRNIGLGAAFLAAEAGEPVRMEHVRRAACSEYVKIGRPLSEIEALPWS
jgi:ATPase family protein associated with various cellular activities (AAA)/winged helix domain-containing protein